MWMLTNQSGRRNESKAMRTYKMGVAYNSVKKEHGGDRKSSGQNDHLINSSDKLAEQFGVSEVTIRRAAKEAKRIDKLSSKERLKILLEGEKPMSNEQKQNYREQVLAAVKLPDCTKAKLESITSKFSGPLGVLRKEWSIPLKDGIYSFDGKHKPTTNGKAIKRTTKDGDYEIVLKSRFELPEDQEKCIERVTQIIDDLQKMFKNSSSYKINYNRFHKCVGELGELMRVFQAAK